MSRIPRWGRIVAEPHEYLIHQRGGRVRTSGHGASCFKWPSDSVALVSTSIAKLSFTADQVTREKVGVEVTGLAVYRIVDPIIAHRMLDGDQLKLSEVLRDMFVGATRRIVATLTLEECITHRKERVARALIEEIAPVLGGQGMTSDATSMGWGVVIDTIEIQNVRVLSQEVFARLQAPYRESLQLQALVAKEKVEEERARLAFEKNRTAEQAELALLAEQSERVLAIRAREIESQRHEEELARAKLRAELVRHEERRAMERKAADADLEADLLHQRRTTEAAEARAAVERSMRHEAGILEAELAKTMREARGSLNEAQLRELLLTETMPRMAEAFRATFDTVTIHQTSGGAAEALGFLTAGIDRVFDTVTAARERGSKPEPE